MKNSEGIRRNDAIFMGCVLATVFTFFLVINFITPIMGEDYVLNAFSPSYQPTGLADFLHKLGARIWEQMTGWNVRLGEQLSIVFGCFDKSVFNILNSFASLYYLWLINLYAFPNFTKGKCRAFGFLLAFSSVVLFQPALGEIFFWRTGSTNYLWALNILLTFTYPIRCFVSVHSKDVIGESKCKTATLTVLGFFAGFTNENTVITFLVLYAGVILYLRIQKKHIPTWICSSFAALFAGCVFMLKAPSTAKRVSYYNQLFGTENLQLVDYLRKIPGVVVRFFRDNQYMVLMTFVCLLCSLILCSLKNNSDKSEKEAALSEPFCWLMLTSISCGALVMSPYIETRAFLLTDFMMTVNIVFCLTLPLKNQSLGKIYIPLSVVLIVVTFPCMSNIYQSYQEYNHFCAERESAIKTSELEKVYWGEYYGPYTSRILTTREDYSMGNESGLEYYFSKDIEIIQNYIFSDTIGIEDYTEHEAVGYTDWLAYDASKGEVTTGGWLAFPDAQDDDCEIYVYIEMGQKRYYYKARQVERPDVAEALSDNKYLHCGYQVNMELFGEMRDQEELKVGIYLVDRSKKIFNGTECGVVALGGNVEKDTGV